MSALNVKEKSVIRSNFYEAINDFVLGDTDLASTSEPIDSGLLFHTADGASVEVRVIVKDETKFSLEAARVAYQEKLDNAAARAAKRAELDAAKATKHAEAEAKKAAKVKVEPVVEETPEV